MSGIVPVSGPSGGQEDDRHAGQLRGLGAPGPRRGPVGERGEHDDRQHRQCRVEHRVDRQRLARGAAAIGTAIALSDQRAQRRPAARC